MAAAIHPDITALLEGAALRLDVDDARRAQAILCRQRTGDELRLAGEAWTEALPKYADPFRQDDAVDAVLEVRVLVAHVDLTEGVLACPRCLQEDLIERQILAATRLTLDRPLRDRIGRCTDPRLDGDAGRIELLRRQCQVE